jgi:hypothetical protein
MQLCGGKPSEGVFVGAFLSMSSTAVVTLSTDLYLISHMLILFLLGEVILAHYCQYIYLCHDA